LDPLTQESCHVHSLFGDYVFEQHCDETHRHLQLPENGEPGRMTAWLAFHAKAALAVVTTNLSNDKGAGVLLAR
jgi:hypothetical protein